MSAPVRRESESIKMQCDDIDLAQQLYGPQNEYLRLIEKKLHVTVNTRGNQLTVVGEAHDAQLAEKVLQELYAMLKAGQPVFREDVDRAIRILSENHDANLATIFRESIFIPTKKRVITPRNQSQRSYLEVMRNHDLVFAIGPAGTGKTYLAVAMAVHFLLTKKVNRVVLSRPAVEAGERLGFLPGDIAEKINPYLRPLYDALYDMLGPDQVHHLMETDIIEVAPLAFMRGRTLNSAFIIVDEAQNCTIEQLKMALTRIGFGSRAVVAGDVTQTDLPEGQALGVLDAEKRLKTIEGIAFQYFGEGDVVRHDLVAKIVSAYEKNH